jgi:hypothetical protein
MGGPRLMLGPSPTVLLRWDQLFFWRRETRSATPFDGRLRSRRVEPRDVPLIVPPSGPSSPWCATP